MVATMVLIEVVYLVAIKEGKLVATKLPYLVVTLYFD
jgi:hypothetical protein